MDTKEEGQTVVRGAPRVGTTDGQSRFEFANGGNHKQRGGYYTPPAISHFLAKWAITADARHILEPSAGDGVLVEAASRCASEQATITAVELYTDEAAKVRARALPGSVVVAGDLFKWFGQERPNGRFDAVIGNPPFIRYQDFEEAHREPAFWLMRQAGLRPSRLTNAWVPFIVAATQALREGGRFAFVVPAELLQVTYAAELREYLVSRYSDLTIVSFRTLVFDGIQQETLLLLGVRGNVERADIRFVELDDLEDLHSKAIESATPVPVSLDHAREKWTRYYLSAAELNLVQGLENAKLLRLGALAEVDVGIVTGRNEFFVLSDEEALTLGLRESCLPLVARSAHIPGVILRAADWLQLVNTGAKCYLLQLGNRDKEILSSEAIRYVESGEAQGFHENYKCRIRLPRWWSVPSTWVPDAFMLRQIHDGPRIVRNMASATCTDTIHRVRLRDTVPPFWVSGASMNSLTWSFAELLGRSYGGGVLELEPTEAERLPFPRPCGEIEGEAVDDLARRAPVDEVLDYVDNRVFRASELSKADLQLLRGIWCKLFQRRKARKTRHA
jgi:adenine-specific DNA methylase